MRGKTKYKVLQIEPSLMEYRIPIYNIISKSVDYTVCYVEEDKSKSECKFKKFKIQTTNFGPVTFLTRDSRRILKDYDVVITSPSLRFLDSISLGLIRHSYKSIGWNIGIRASYTVNYDVTRKHNILDGIYGWLLFKFDALVFYMEESKIFWKNKKMDKVFVAPNTTAVENSVFSPSLKKNYLFVGTLYKSKGLDVLIRAYHEACLQCDSIPQLEIVGGGAEREVIEELVKELNLSEKVVFYGPIYDEKVLAERFEHALISISPNQAGLSVPKSMGYGVPFITRKNAITGGEIFHITNGTNGLLYVNDGELIDIMCDAAKNPNKYIEMGQKSLEYYNTYATPQIMANAVIDAINYVMV